MSIVVTGGAGFIGSCVVRSLNDMGFDDIIIVDHISSTGKWKNISNKKYRAYYHKNQFLEQLEQLESVEAVIHMGACSSTVEKDFDYLWQNNVEYTRHLWNYCSENRITFIYASSAATYGDGSNGFDDKKNIFNLRPLNAYGYSKQMFDYWSEQFASIRPPHYVGLKFFNVYGPNEYYKGNMASMVFHGFHQIVESGEIRLFKSYNEKYSDGEQMRDFIYVKDVCDVIMWLLEHKEVNGIYNVGSGNTSTFQELAEAAFFAMDVKTNIRYIDMPDEIKDKYQYYTCADMKKLRSEGYIRRFHSLKEGVYDYVKGYLLQGCKCY